MFAALAGVDRIVHLGDIGAVGALERFARVAPVFATRGAHAVGDDPRMSPGAFVIDAGTHIIGALFDLTCPPPKLKVSAGGIEWPQANIAELIADVFGQPVHVVAHAATHRACIAQRDGILFINPGSPNLPVAANERGRGTIAIAELEPGSAVRAEIVEL